MTMTDPIADMLTRLRNIAAVGKSSVRLPHSKLKQAVADVLVKEGYLTKASKDGNDLVLELAANGSRAKITGIKRISKPGQRTYASLDELPYVRRGLGIAVVSTPKGVMTAKEAKRQRVGGEVLLEVF